MAQLYEFEGQQFSFPDDATQDEALAYINQQFPYEAPPPQPSESGFGEQFAGSFWGTLTQENPRLAGRAIEGLGRFFGSDTVTDWGSEIVSDFEAEPDKEAFVARVPSLTQIKDLDTFLDYVGQGLGQGVASLGVPLAGAVAGGIAGAPGGPIGVGVGMRVGAGTGSFLQNYGDTYDYLVEQEKVDPDTAASIALGPGVAMAALDMAGLSALTAPFRKKTKEKIAHSVAKRMLQFGKKGLTVEALTEGAQQIIQETTGEYTEATGASPEDIQLAQRVENIANAIAIGGLTGGFVGSVGGPFARPTPDPVPPPDPTEGLPEEFEAVAEEVPGVGPPAILEETAEAIPLEPIPQPPILDETAAAIPTTRLPEPPIIEETIDATPPAALPGISPVDEDVGGEAPAILEETKEIITSAIDPVHVDIGPAEKQIIPDISTLTDTVRTATIKPDITPAILSQIRKNLLRRFGSYSNLGDKVPLIITDTIAGIYGQKVGDEAIFIPQEAAVKRAILIALDGLPPATLKNPKWMARYMAGLLDHETIHALVDMKTLDAADIKALTEAANEVPHWTGQLRDDGSVKSVMEVVRETYSDLSETEQLEEVAAELFRGHASGQNFLKGRPLTIWQRILNFFRNLKGGLADAKIYNAAQVFDRIIDPTPAGFIPTGARTEDFPEELEESLSKKLEKEKQEGVKEARAFSGSPVPWGKALDRVFGKPDLAFQGTGEDTTMEGWGYYAGQVRDTGAAYRADRAQEWRNQDAVREIVIDGVPQKTWEEPGLQHLGDEYKGAIGGVLPNPLRPVGGRYPVVPASEMPSLEELVSPLTYANYILQMVLEYAGGRRSLPHPSLRGRWETGDLRPSAVDLSSGIVSHERGHKIAALNDLFGSYRNPQEEKALGADPQRLLKLARDYLSGSLDSLVYQIGPAADAVTSEALQLIDQWIAAGTDVRAAIDAPTLYEIDVPDADMALFMDADLAFDKQSPEVQEALTNVVSGVPQKYIPYQLDPKRTVNGIYRALTEAIEKKQGIERGEAKKVLSLALADEGVPGLRYWDQLSRDKPIGVFYNGEEIDENNPYHLGYLAASRAVRATAGDVDLALEQATASVERLQTSLALATEPAFGPKGRAANRRYTQNLRSTLRDARDLKETLEEWSADPGSIELRDSRTYNYVIWDQDVLDRSEVKSIDDVPVNQIASNLSVVNAEIPGLAALQEQAQTGNQDAIHLLQDIATDALTYLLSGIPTATFQILPSQGVYAGEGEPSVGLLVGFAEPDRQDTLVALKQFSTNFNQEQLHVLDGDPNNNIPGFVHPDGSYNTIAVRYLLPKPLSRAKIDEVIKSSGLPGLTVTDTYLEAYYWGDPNDTAAIQEFQQQANRARQSLGKSISRANRSIRRFWAYGSGFAATNGYQEISGTLRLPAYHEGNRTSHRIAQFLRGLPFATAVPQTTLTPEERTSFERIADNYDAMPDDDSGNPAVKRAYTELQRESISQFDALPVKVEVFEGEGEPYANSAAMRDDVMNNNHLYILKTDESDFSSNHPLIKQSGRVDMNGTFLLYNDVLRAVHDYYAHTMSPLSLGKFGGKAAYVNHARMMASPWARWALATETLGNNAWFNFHRLGIDPAKRADSLPIEERPFAPQKIGLLPIEDTMIGDPLIDEEMSAIDKEKVGRSRGRRFTGEEVAAAFAHSTYEPEVEEVRINPSRHVITRMAQKYRRDHAEGLVGRVGKRAELRFAYDNKGELYVWDAYVISHEGMAQLVRHVSNGQVKLPPSMGENTGYIHAELADDGSEIFEVYAPNWEGLSTQFNELDDLLLKRPVRELDDDGNPRVRLQGTPQTDLLFQPEPIETALDKFWRKQDFVSLPGIELHEENELNFIIGEWDNDPTIQNLRTLEALTIPSEGYLENPLGDAYRVYSRLLREDLGTLLGTPDAPNADLSAPISGWYVPFDDIGIAKDRAELGPPIDIQQDDVKFAVERSPTKRELIVETPTTPRGPSEDVERANVALDTYPDDVKLVAFRIDEEAFNAENRNAQRLADAIRERKVKQSRRYANLPASAFALETRRDIAGNPTIVWGRVRVAGNEYRVLVPRGTPQDFGLAHASEHDEEFAAFTPYKNATQGVAALLDAYWNREKGAPRNNPAITIDQGEKMRIASPTKIGIEWNDPASTHPIRGWFDLVVPEEMPGMPAHRGGLQRLALDTLEAGPFYYLETAHPVLPKATQRKVEALTKMEALGEYQFGDLSPEAIEASVNAFLAKGTKKPKMARSMVGSPPTMPKLELKKPAVTKMARVMTGTGRDYTDFFTAATLGVKHRPSTGNAYIPVIGLTDYFGVPALYDKWKGNFEHHIKTSIPGFGEVQLAVAEAIVNTYGDGSTMLDVGASEGALIKTITSLSGGAIKTTGIDPNIEMAKVFQKDPVPGSDYKLEAFGSREQEGTLAWAEDDGTPIYYFQPPKKYDVVHEAMVFQFISPDREPQIKRMKELAKKNGLVIIEEKVFEKDGMAARPAWDQKEAKKNKFKSRYYSVKEMTAKSRETLEGMHKNMISEEATEDILVDNFETVAQFWDSGNFKGYVASDSAAAVNKFLANLQSLDTEFATVETPRFILEPLRPSPVDELLRPSQVDMRIRQMAFENDVLSGVITEDTPGVDPGEVRAILADEANKVKEARRMVAGAVQLGEYPVLPRKPRAPTSRRTFTQLIKDAKSARNYRDWYERHRPILHELFGDDMQLFNDIISITSQQKRIDRNIDLALVVYEAIKTGDPLGILSKTATPKLLLDPVVDNINRLMGRLPSREGTLRERAGKPPTELPGGGARYFAGKKIPDMIQAMRDADEAVVVDRHIAQLLFNRDSPTEGMVLEAQRLITKVANELRWTPIETQAALWAFNQVRKGMDLNNVRDYEKALTERASRIKELVKRVQVTQRAGAGVRPRGAVAKGVAEGAKAKAARPFYDITDTQYDSLRGHGMRLTLDQRPDRATLTIQSGDNRIEVRGHPAVGSRYEGSRLDRIIDSIPQMANLSALFAGETRNISASMADPIIDALELEDEIQRRIFSSKEARSFIKDKAGKKAFEEERQRNVIAEDLRTPKYRKRVVRSRKGYTRKDKHKRPYQAARAFSFLNKEEGVGDVDLSMISAAQTTDETLGSKVLTNLGMLGSTPLDSYTDFFKWFRQSVVDMWDPARRTDVYLAESDTKYASFLSAASSAWTALRSARRGTAITAYALSKGVPVYANGGTSVKNIPKDAMQTNIDGSLSPSPIAGTPTGLIPIIEPLREGNRFRTFHAYAIGRRAARLLREGRERLLTQDQIIEYLGYGNTPLEIQRIIGDPALTEDAIARKIIATGQDTFLDFDQIFKNYQVWNSYFVDLLVDTGVIDRKKADQWTETADYVPFYRQLDQKYEEVLGETQVFSGITTRPPPPLSGKGTIWTIVTKETINGEEIVTRLPTTFESHQKAVAKGYAKKLKQEHPNLEVSVVEGGMPIGGFLDTLTENALAAVQTGMMNVGVQRAMRNLVLVEPETTVRAKIRTPGAITFRVKGKSMTLFVGDQLLFSSLFNYLEHQRIPPWVNLFGMPARFLREMITRSPDFMAANMLRDSLSAWVTSGRKTGALAGTMKGMYSAVRGDESANALASAGLMTGFDFGGDPTKMTTFIEKELQKYQYPSEMRRAIRNPFKYLWDVTGTGSRASDAATRIAVYNRVLKETGDEVQAFWEAQEVINFSARGSSALIQNIAVMVPFLNARIQGLDVLYRSSMGRPGFAARPESDIVKRRFLMRSLLVGMSSAAYWTLVHDDEEYINQNPEVKDNYWIIPSSWIPGYDGPPIKIPIPFEVGYLFKTIPERLMALFLGQDVPLDVTQSLRRGLVNTFEFNPIPQAVLPLGEALVNYSFWTGREIEGQYLKGIEPGYRYASRTSGLARELGEAINYSPIKIDHMIKGYGGTLGTVLLDTVDQLVRSVDDELGETQTRKLTEYPFIRRFFARPDARGLVTQFYQLREAVTQAVGTYDMLEKGELTIVKSEEFADKRAALLDLEQEVNAIAQILADLREERKSIMEGDMSGEEKRALIDDITQDELLAVQDLPAMRQEAFQLGR